MSSNKNDKVPPLPNETTYWVIPSKLMAGSHPADKSGDEGKTRVKLAAYLDAGVTSFVDLTEPGQRSAYDAIMRSLARERGIDDVVEYVRTPFPDDAVPTTDQMKTILDAIDGSLGRDKTVYVHCAGGIGRTGTTVACHLVRHGMSGENALKKLNEELYSTSQLPQQCATSPATDEQKEYVRNWKG